MEKQLFIIKSMLIHCIAIWHWVLFISVHCVYCNSWLCCHVHFYSFFLPMVPLDLSMLWFWLIYHYILLLVFYFSILGMARDFTLFQSIQTHYGAHPASSAVDAGHKGARGWSWTGSMIKWIYTSTRSLPACSTQGQLFHPVIRHPLTFLTDNTTDIFL